MTIIYICTLSSGFQKKDLNQVNRLIIKQSTTQTYSNLQKNFRLTRFYSFTFSMTLSTNKFLRRRQLETRKYVGTALLAISAVLGVAFCLFKGFREVIEFLDVKFFVIFFIFFEILVIKLTLHKR